MGIAKLLTDRVAGFWSKEYDIKDFTLSSVIGDIYTFRLNANTFSLDISYDKINKVITDYVVISGKLVANESLLMLNLTDLISQGIMNSEVSDTVFAHVEFVNASIAQYLEIINSASELRNELDNKNTTLLSTIETAVDQTEVIEQITNLISSSSLNTVANSIGLIQDVVDMEYKLDYTKYTLEPKLDNLSLFEDKLTLVTSEPLKQSILDAENNAGVATTKAEESSDSADASKLDRWIAEAQKLTADSYATEPEDVFVKIYTSNGDGTFSHTNSTEHSSFHWAIKAQGIVSNGILDDDDTPSTFKTYSSNKIEAELLERDNRLYTSESALDTKSDKSFTNTATSGAGILVGNGVIEWTKGFTSFTGAILIELTGLYDEASMVGRMKIVINQAVGDDRVLYIDGRWLSTTHIWDEANVIEVSTALTKLNVRFCRDVVNSKVYLVIGETSSSWNALRIMIDEVLTNYNLSLNLWFVITSTTDISGLTVDYTKTDVQDSNTDDYLGSLITGVLI